MANESEVKTVKGFSIPGDCGLAPRRWRFHVKANFESGSDNTTRAITPDGVYRESKRYAKKRGIDIAGFGAHSLRATAATNALLHDANIAKVRELLGHANISTGKLYDQRESRPEDCAVFRVK